MTEPDFIQENKLITGRTGNSSVPLITGIKDTPRLGVVGFMLVVLRFMMVWVVSYQIWQGYNVIDEFRNFLHAIADYTNAIQSFKRVIDLCQESKNHSGMADMIINVCDAYRGNRFQV